MKKKHRCVWFNSLGLCLRSGMKCMTICRFFKERENNGIPTKTIETEVKKDIHKNSKEDQYN